MEVVNSNCQSDRLSRLEAQIAHLTSSINKLRARSRSHSKKRTSQIQTFQDTDKCWYHRTFGNRATKCVHPCAFQPQIQNKSEN